MAIYEICFIIVALFFPTEQFHTHLIVFPDNTPCHGRLTGGLPLRSFCSKGPTHAKGNRPTEAIRLIIHHVHNLFRWTSVTSWIVHYIPKYLPESGLWYHFLAKDGSSFPIIRVINYTKVCTNLSSSTTYTSIYQCERQQSKMPSLWH